MANRTKKIIVEVFPFIYSGYQRACIKLEGWDRIPPYTPQSCIYYVEADCIKNKTGVRIEEAEILKGSELIPTFYSVGEIMGNGKACNFDYDCVKEYNFTLIGTITEIRMRNKNELQPLVKIQNVFTFIRNERQVVALKLYDGRTIFINPNRLTKLTTIEANEFNILEESFVNPVFYKVGEIIYKDVTCKKDGVLIKTLNLRFAGTIEEMRSNFRRLLKEKILAVEEQRKHDDLADEILAEAERQDWYRDEWEQDWDDN